MPAQNNLQFGLCLYGVTAATGHLRRRFSKVGKCMSDYLMTCIYHALKSWLQTVDTAQK